MNKKIGLAIVYMLGIIIIIVAGGLMTPQPEWPERVSFLDTGDVEENNRICRASCERGFEVPGAICVDGLCICFCKATIEVPPGFYLDSDGCLVGSIFRSNPEAVHCYKCFNDKCNYHATHDCSDCDDVMLAPTPEAANDCLEFNKRCVFP